MPREIVLNRSRSVGVRSQVETRRYCASVKSRGFGYRR